MKLGEFVVRTEDFVLYPNGVKMCFDEAEKEVVHGINNDLLNKIKVRQTRELRESGCVIFDKIVARCWISKGTILVTELALLLVLSSAGTLGENRSKRDIERT